MYPIIFLPIYKEMIWGGDRLKMLYNRNLPSGKIGESWDISCRETDMGIVENGEFKGMSFIELIKKDPFKVLGINNFKRFPLLVKIIDANDKLSVQVHPSGDDIGKSESWYILHEPYCGYLYIGLKEYVTKDIFQKAISQGTAEECLNKLYVKAGDFIDIPAGLVHALTSGTIVAEIQQNSDTTYRLYDYNRIGLDGKQRELHINAGLAVCDFENKLQKSVIKGKIQKSGENITTHLISNDFYTINKYEIKQPLYLCTNNTFEIIICVFGEVLINTTMLTAGKMALIPAGLQDYMVKPKEHAIILKAKEPLINI